MSLSVKTVERVDAIWQSAGLSDPGCQRENNEDRWLADDELGLYVVVDGVGGAAAGEKAAEVAIEMLRARLTRAEGDAARRLREAITLANNEIYRLAQENQAWRGMACVLTAALRQDEQVTIGHIGDTRCYHLVGREMVKITSDHSPVGAQEDAGLLSEGAAMNHPARNQILRDLGSAPHTPDDPDFIDIYEFTATPASALLLCSDGLTDVLTANQIQDIISTHADEPKSVVRELIAAANAAGGPDNITAVLAGGPDYAKGKLSALPPASGKPASRRRVWLNRMLIFLLGFILGALAFWWTATRGPAKLRQRLVNLLQVAEK